MKYVIFWYKEYYGDGIKKIISFVDINGFMCFCWCFWFGGLSKDEFWNIVDVVLVSFF